MNTTSEYAQFTDADLRKYANYFADDYKIAAGRTDDGAALSRYVALNCLHEAARELNTRRSQRATGIKVEFETEECDRCGGTGEYSYNPRDGKRCFKCRGSRVQYTRRGLAARKAYDVVMDEMNRTWGDIVKGSVVQYRVNTRPRWYTVESVEDDKLNQGFVTITLEGVANFSGGARVESKIRIWDGTIYRRAAARVERMAGATVTGLDA